MTVALNWAPAMLTVLLSLKPAASGWAPTAPLTRLSTRRPSVCMQLAAERTVAWGPITVPEPLLEKLQGAGYYRPMPIQCEAMQLIADGDNVILHAATGSGKTVAFLAPLLASLDQEAGLQLVVVTPSQELAVQIATEARLLHREGAVLLALSTSDEAQAEQELSLQRSEAPVRPPRTLPPPPAAQRDGARPCLTRARRTVSRCRSPSVRRRGCSTCSAAGARARASSGSRRWCSMRWTRCCRPPTPPPRPSEGTPAGSWPLSVDAAARAVRAVAARVAARAAHAALAAPTVARAVVGVGRAAAAGAAAGAAP
jgi:hypothetical protein